MAIDVGEHEFQERVIARSREVPVVVDFWAEWCGPCRTLGPALEAAVGDRDGAVELAKVDVDANQRLAAAYGIRGIPAVKAFKDGELVAEFTGAVPPARIEAFLDTLVPSESDRLAGAGDEASLRKALEADPSHSAAAIALARLLLGRGDANEALTTVRAFPQDLIAAGLAARAELALRGADEFAPAFEAWDDGDHARALELLQTALDDAGEERRDLIRRVMVAIFTELGPSDPLAREHRRRLAAALN